MRRVVVVVDCRVWKRQVRVALELQIQDSIWKFICLPCRFHSEDAGDVCLSLCEIRGQ